MRGDKALVCSALSAWLLLFFIGCSATPQHSVGLLPDTAGTLKVVTLSVNSARRAALRNASLVTNIVNALPEDVIIYILSNDLSAFILANNPWPDRVHFLEIPEENAITIWPQDPFLVLRKKAGTTLLQSKEFKRAEDSVMADVVAKERKYEVLRSELYFEGGNIVSDESQVFVGANTVRHNALKNSMSESEVVRQFQDELGRKIFVVGPFPQPIGHIDMMMTPLGDNTIAVADAFSGIRVVKEELKQHPEKVDEFEKLCEAYFFGHPSIESLPLPFDSTLDRPKLTGETKARISKTSLLAPILEGIANSLEQLGFKIVRIPFFGSGVESLESSSTPEEFEPRYPMLTYNNALLHEGDSAREVFIPHYGLEALDNAATKAWEDAGFVVHAIPGFATSAMYGGALRCTTKVLERDL